jgi:toxin YoeB
LKVVFSGEGWEDYLYWSENDGRLHAKLNRLINDARRTPHSGIGKPEPLKGNLAGWWSRRLAGDHRLVYRVEGKGVDQQIIVAQCRYHYD